MYVEIALNIPADKIFTYEVPADLQQEVKIGQRAFVPLGNKKRTGFIVGINQSCDLKSIKSIAEILDDEPLFSASDLDFYQWIANYFMYPLGKTLAELIPSGVEKKDFFWIIPLTPETNIHLPPAQEKLLEFLHQYPQGIALNNINKISGLKNISSAARALQSAGLVQIEKRQSKQLSVQSEKIVTLEEDKITGAKLTEKQKKLIEFIQKTGAIPLNNLIEKSNISGAVIKRLRDRGIINFTDKEKVRTTSLDSAISCSNNAIILNDQQTRVMEEISHRLEEKRFYSGTSSRSHGQRENGNLFKGHRKSSERRRFSDLSCSGNSSYTAANIACCGEI